MNGPSSTTTTTPSPFDQQKADIAGLMRTYLMPMIQSGISGQATGLQDASTQNIVNQAREKSGRLGIESGTPQFQDYERSMNESLTKPNQDMLKLAMNMYNSSQPQGGGSSSTSTNPGTLNEITSVGQLAMLAALLA